MDKEFIDYLQFDTLKDPALELMRDNIALFMAELIANKSPRWISLLGSSGTGKTHLAVKVYDYFRKNHKVYQGRADPAYDIIVSKCHDIGFYKSSHIACSLRNGDYSVMTELKNAHFVVIDDFAGEMDSQFMSSKWFEIFDLRMGKWTVITANHVLQNISEQMDSRIASRLIRDNNQVIDCCTNDYGFRK